MTKKQLAVRLASNGRFRDTGGRFVKLAEAGVDLVTVKDVELAALGHWEAKTGPVDFTKKMFEDAVRAQEDPSIRAGVVKLGHDVFQMGEGEPALGRIVNMRLNDTGTKILGDLEDVPKDVAELIPYAWPDRSIEGELDYTSDTGEKYDLIISGIALLGAWEPAVKGLEGVKALFRGESVLKVAAAAADASDPVRQIMAAAITVDRVRMGYYDEAQADEKPGQWMWVREVWVSDGGGGFLIAEDEDTGRLYRVPWSITAQSEVKYEAHEEVKVNYVTAGEAAPGERPIARDLTNIRDHVSVSATVRANEEPGSPEDDKLDPKEIRQKLGLPEDASDEDVESRKALLGEARTAELLGEADPDPDADQDAPDPDKDADTPDPEAMTPAQVAAAAKKLGLSVVDETVITELRTGAEAGIQARRQQEADTRKAVLAGALQAGKITRASYDKWDGRLQKDFSGTKEILDELPGGIAAPVIELGHGGSPVDDLAQDAALDKLDSQLDERMSDLGPAGGAS